MSQIIIKNPRDQSEYSKRKIDIENFRAVGELPSESIFIITEKCLAFKIEEMNLQDFISLLKINTIVSQPGLFIRAPIVCKYCGGSGLTDWVSAVIGTRSIYTRELTFKRDKKASFIKITKDLFIKGSLVTYLSRAFCDESYEYCKNCRGTGLFMAGYIMSDPEEKATVTIVKNLGE